MSDFKTVVFSGGGSRCLWQIGFWDTVAPAIKLKPEIMAGVSAGAAMAGMIATGTSTIGIRLIREATSLNKRNFYIQNVVRREPSFPHHRIYRNTILNTIDNAALKKLKNGPEVRVMFAHPPVYLGARTGTFVGLLSYVIEKYTTRPVHPKLASKLGYTYTVARLNDCRSAEEAADLIICSSCTPPFVPIMRHNGRIALDGGIIDNVPVSAVGADESRGRMLIMMSRIHRDDRIPKIPGRVYVQPSETPPIGKWDYTNPDGLQGAYDRGRYDGDLFIKRYRNGEI